MKLFIALPLVILAACSTPSPKKKVLAREKWIGLTTKDIEKHPYFKNLPVKKLKNTDGVETWVYRDQTNYQSSAYCQSLGGCMGMPFYNCDNAFSIKDGTILGYDQNGSCPPAKSIEPVK